MRNHKSTLRLRRTLRAIGSRPLWSTENLLSGRVLHYQTKREALAAAANKVCTIVRGDNGKLGTFYPA